MGNLLTRITDCQRRMKNMFDVFEGATPKVLILGLDGAGKTTFLYSAKLDDFIYAIAPPKGVIIEHISPRRGATLQLFDFPGSKLVRHLWHNWFQNTQGIIFVVDSSDKVRIDEAKFELHDLLTSSWLRKVPLVVVANKQDLPECLTEDEVANELDLHSIRNRDWSIFGVSSKTKKGVKHVFDDMVEKVKAFRHYKSSLREQEKTKKQSKEKDFEIEIKGSDNPVFTSIEDVDAMDEKKIPSLFENISKSSSIEKDSNHEVTDSGFSSKESVTYDQMNVNKGSTEHSDGEKPDSLSDCTSDKDEEIQVKDNESSNKESMKNIENESLDSHKSADRSSVDSNEDSEETSKSVVSKNESKSESDNEEIAISFKDDAESSNEGAAYDGNENNDDSTISERESLNDDESLPEESEDNTTEKDSTCSADKTTINQNELVTDLDNISDDEEQK